MKRLAAILTIVLTVAGLSTASIADQYNSLAAFQGATSNLTLINFDKDTQGNSISGSLGSIYAPWGIVFGQSDYSSGAAGPVSSPNGWFVPSSTTPFTASFTVSNITAVGVHQVLYSGQSGAILTAYDSGNNVIGSVSSDSDTYTLDFFGLTTTANITHFDITFNQPAYGWGLDDLYFGQAGNVSPVPEPGTILLLGLGLTGIAGVRRMK